jgi:hypothetical protein
MHGSAVGGHAAFTLIGVFRWATSAIQAKVFIACGL